MISFYSEGSDFNLRDKLKHKRWIKQSLLIENQRVGEINFIFTSDEEILKINKKHLNHNYYTDVITFNTTDYFNKKLISGDIFISVDTVRTNATLYKQTFENELKRVMIHGVLHLVGYDDQNKEQKNSMREREDELLQLYEQI